MKRAFAQRQIPTLLGLGVLIAALVGGIALIGTGGGVFAPRATPQTTPKNLKITNVKDTSFTVSFMTDEATAGFIKYGKTPDNMTTQASDDRDQLSGTVGQYSTHYVTLRDLDPDTQYYFIVGTTSVPRFDSNGEPFTLKTAKRGGNPTAAKTAYGTVNSSSGAPADGAIVYMNINGVGELSALVKGSGSWAIPLSNARTTNLAAYANLQPTDGVSIFVQGTQINQVASTNITVADTQPVPTLTLATGTGSTQEVGLQADVTTVDTTTENGETSPDTFSPTDSLTALGTVQETPEASADAVEASPLASPTTQTADTVDLTIPEQQTVETDKPTITGKAAPNTLITVQIHSETEITTQVQTDANGDFVLPLSGGTHSLEPGEHTVTLTYTDPDTGEEKTVVRTFFVSGPGTDTTLLAQASSSPTPFGTNNPFTIPTPTPSPSPVPSPSPTASSSATPSASPRVVVPATDSALPESGSTGITIGLIFAGIFMMGVGVWSYHYNLEQALIDSEDDTA